MRWLLVAVVAASVGGAAGNSLNDFSNNLATDLGPLLTLFGDAMTKQYLSESTSFLDYLIFAMAPIGIVTAVVSTIRLCGHSSLRAFIGRSQEGEGDIEAELCTSTSRDVCELFNRGGIARVLGKPSILELVYEPPRTTGVTGDPKEAQLRLSRDYFGSKSSLDWEEVEGSVFERPIKAKAVTEDFAPNANLSLNVGIVKQPTWVFVTIAATGVSLQVGVLILAGVGVWHLGWNLSNSVDNASRDYAPVMFIAGTVVMCAGMWACAYLIGQTTHEVRFRRRIDKSAAEPPRLFWLQPGPQVIGDQSFDPYGHVEDTRKAPLRLWMSSRKHFDERVFEVNTVIAVSAVVVGYIAQFIGLRGMKAWVALAQLAITVVMSFLRGCLRMQRLGKESNELAEIPDLVSGHELDWLSLTIAQQKRVKWHVTGHYYGASQTAKSVKKSLADSEIVPDDKSLEISHDLKQLIDVSVSPASHVIGPSNVADIQHLLQIRTRLAHLTDHQAMGNLPPSEYQNWKDEDVKVRLKAKQISTALCQIAEKLLIKPQQRVIQLRMQIGAHRTGGTEYSNQTAEVALEQGAASSPRGWIIDSARIEAILGLWLWTLTHDPISQDDPDATQNEPKEIPMAMMVSASADDKGWSDRAGKTQTEINLWLGPNAVEFGDKTIMVNPQDFYSFGSLWRPSAGDSKPCWENAVSFTDHPGKPVHRLCGWTSVHRADMEPQSSHKLRVQYVDIHPAQASLLDVCARELFTTLLMSLSGLLKFGPATVLESAGTGRLENETVDTLASEFAQSGLGSYYEALLCIMPALRERSPSPKPKALLKLIVEAVDNYRRAHEHDRADVLLRWFCNSFKRAPKGHHGIRFEQAAWQFETHGIIASQISSVSSSQPQPEILAAHYGGRDITIFAKWLFCRGERIEVLAKEHELCHYIKDPWMYVRKTLSVIYRFNDGEIRGCIVQSDSNRTYTLTKDRPEGDLEQYTFVASNYASEKYPDLRIHAVLWGMEQVEDKEVYDNLYNNIVKSEQINLGNGFFKKDGWWANQKTAAIVYSYRGTVMCVSGRENTQTTIHI
ncbi:hypothetical protein G7046_g697 [Stylonectria norvegica]|nr:hypothetical protein G7046_g697 [Stylonectria norvegica]